LTLSDDQFRLDLEGTLHQPSAEKGAPVSGLPGPLPDVVDRVLGETIDRKDVTLESCALVGHGTSSGRRGTTYSEAYRPSVVCVGAWFEAEEPLAVDLVFVRLSSLHPWSAVSGFDPEWQTSPDDNETTVQTYKPPPSRRATLSDGTIIELAFPLVEETEGLFTFAKTFTQASRFKFEYPEPRLVEGVQEHVHVLRNFLTLAVGEPVKVTNLVGYRKPLSSDDPPIGREVEILYQHVEHPRAREALNHHGMLFLLPDIADRFDEHIIRWFERASELGRVLDLFFSTRNLEFTYLETRFMNFVQAIEGYHRRRLNRNMYDEAIFAEYREAILEHVKGRPRALAKRVLGKYANEVNLETRIKDVVEHLGYPGSRVLAWGTGTMRVPADFARRVAQIRNAYAHNLEGDEPDARELAVVTHQLSALIEAVLLLEIGFEPSVIDTRLDEARRYRLIRALARAD
jgi:hypothetical protein